MKSSVSFTLRAASIEDAPLFYRVIDKTMRELIVETWGAWNELRVQSESREDSCSPNAQVIQVDSFAAGVLLVEKLPTYIQLEQLYLLPDYQRLGIGTALLNSLITASRQSNLPIRLRVMSVNPAKNFYDRLGFVVIETMPDFLLMEKMP